MNIKLSFIILIWVTAWVGTSSIKVEITLNAELLRLRSGNLSRVTPLQRKLILDYSSLIKEQQHYISRRN